MAAAAGDDETNTTNTMCEEKKIDENSTSNASSVKVPGKSSEEAQADAEQHESSARTSAELLPKKRRLIRPFIRKTVRAFWRSLWEVDYTQLAFVPGIRTAILLILEWSLLGIGNPTTTAFQLGCLYVGLSDPNGNASRRFRSMGLTVITVMLMGTLLPGLIWDLHPAVNLIFAFLVAFLSGLAPLSREPTLFLSMKLGTALFAINIAVNRNTNGYGGLATSISWTLAGASSSLAFALLPEVVGTRDAVRTDLYKVYNGFGMYLKRFAAHFGTLKHVEKYPVPRVTLSIVRTQDAIYHDKTEDSYAREWLLRIMDKADALRTAAFCLSHLYEMNALRRRQQQIQHCVHIKIPEDDNHDSADENNDMTRNKEESGDNYEGNEKEIHELFLAVGYACRRIAEAFQFPWIVRYTPFVRKHLEVKAPRAVKQAAAVLKAKATSIELSNCCCCQSCRNVGDNTFVNENRCINMAWLPSLVDLLVNTIEEAVKMALNTADQEEIQPEQMGWPPYSSLWSLPRRLLAAFPSPPSRIFEIREDPGCAIRIYALRFGIAFCLASIPDIYLEGTSGHWFPMTVALIMGPTGATTLDKIAHRTIGTLLGIGLGSALYPLFSYPTILIILLGLNTYAVCVLLQPSYVGFSFFITGWVFCATVGTGAKVGVTILYRVMWTLAAAALVVVVTYVYPPKSEYDIPEKLIAMVRAIKLYAQDVKEEHFFIRSVNEADGNESADEEHGKTDENNRSLLLQKAHEKTKLSRKGVIEARVALMNSMNEAILTPVDASTLLLDPHSVVPAIVSHLIDVAIIPQYASLVKGDPSVDDLVATLDEEEPYAELDRLISRLQKQTTHNDEPAPPSPVNPPAARARGEKSAFSSAIAGAHSRLDNAGVP